MGGTESNRLLPLRHDQWDTHTG